MFDLSRSYVPVTGESTAPEMPPEISPLTVVAYGEHDGMGMGMLSNGEAYLTQRGLAALCGVQNAHIGNISRDWHEDKPRIQAIRARLARYGDFRDTPHRVLSYQGRRLYCYDLAVCQAVLDYYAVDAGSKTQVEAQENRVRFRGNGLLSFIITSTLTTSVQPLQLQPVADATEHSDNPWTMMTAHIWGLYVMSFWLAVAYMNTLRVRAEAAGWNRLGLYIPLKAIVEIQAEVMAGVMAAADKPLTFSLRD